MNSTDDNSKQSTRQTEDSNDERNLDERKISSNEEIDLSYKNKTEVTKGGILGLFIGLAVIVPGVSGSAVAIIFKMYEKLLYAIGNLFKKFKKCIKFLLPILIGILVGFVLGFFGVRSLLNIIPFLVICLFAGLMFGAYPAITDQIKGTKLNAKYILLFIIGLAIPILVSCVSVFSDITQHSLSNLKFYHYILFAIIGFLVAITQLVPGLSATALLMSFGYFTPLMNSVSLTNFKENPTIFLVYLCLIIGFIIGLFVVSKGLNKILNRYKTPTFYCIAGLSLGSIVTMFFNPEIMEIYVGWSDGGMVLDISMGVLVFIIGIVISYLFVRFERKKDTNR